MPIFPSIGLCQPISFSCISSTIFHHFLLLSVSLSALIEAVAAGRARPYLIRRLNQWCGLMANPSANKKKKNKERETITSAQSSHPPLFDFQFQSVLLADKSTAARQSAKHLSVYSSAPISHQLKATKLSLQDVFLFLF